MTGQKSLRSLTTAINPGDHVCISLRHDPNVRVEGNVEYVISEHGQNPVQVALRDGSSGTVIATLGNSDEVIRRRILSENQYSENKEIFGEPEMRSGVIPKTVQSFLNSEGGHLYIGIRDTGSLQERLAGIYGDFDLIKKDWKAEETDKMCDELKLRIKASLSKYLVSEAQLGPLIEMDFPSVCGVMILQIKIDKSKKPWFYKNLNRSGNEMKFQLSYKKIQCGERTLDGFYIRDGNGKKRLDTLREFYEYAKDRFINP